MMSKADNPGHLGSHWRVRVVEQVQKSMFFKVLLSVNQVWSWYKYIHVNHLQTHWSITNFTYFVRFPSSTLAILDLHCLSFTILHLCKKGVKAINFGWLNLRSLKIYVSPSGALWRHPYRRMRRMFGSRQLGGAQIEWISGDFRGSVSWASLHSFVTFQTYTTVLNWVN